MIKQIAVALTAMGLSGCGPSQPATPQDLCNLVSAREVARQLDQPITVTKRLIQGPSSPWAYCFYGTMTEHFVTLSAPIAHPAGNVHVVVEPRVADRVQVSASQVPDDYGIESVDLPAACIALRAGAEAVIGSVIAARGSVNPAVLTCDFIGANGTITAQSRPHLLAEHTVLTGEQILDEPDARLTATVGVNVEIDGIVDHRGISIRMSGSHLTAAIKAFARKFLEASG